MGRPPEPGSINRGPTIPQTSLPDQGYQGEIPDPIRPLDGYAKVYWDWAWSTPQAAMWDKGTAGAVTTLSEIHRDIEALESMSGIASKMSFYDLLECTDPSMGPVAKQLGDLFGGLLKMVTNKKGLVAEARSYESVLGLNPKAMSDMRWKVLKEELEIRKEIHRDAMTDELMERKARRMERQAV